MSIFELYMLFVFLPALSGLKVFFGFGSGLAVLLSIPVYIESNDGGALAKKFLKAALFFGLCKHGF